MMLFVLARSSGALTVAAGICAALAYWWASILTRETMPKFFQIVGYFAGPSSGGEEQALNGGMRAIGRLVSTVQGAAAFFAVATVLFAFAAGKLPCDPLAQLWAAAASLLMIIGFAVVILNRSRVNAPRAAAAFNQWYRGWAEEQAASYKDKGASPPQDLTAEAFSRVDPAHCRLLKRYRIFPYD